MSPAEDLATMVDVHLTVNGRPHERPLDTVLPGLAA
jgi:hypothetical protein